MIVFYVIAFCLVVVAFGVGMFLGDAGFLSGPDPERKNHALTPPSLMTTVAEARLNAQKLEAAQILLRIQHGYIGELCEVGEAAAMLIREHLDENDDRDNSAGYCTLSVLNATIAKARPAPAQRRIQVWVQ